MVILLLAERQLAVRRLIDTQYKKSHAVQSAIKQIMGSQLFRPKHWSAKVLSTKRRGNNKKLVNFSIRPPPGAPG